MLAVQKAVSATGLTQVRIAVGNNCNCGAAYAGNGLFIIDRNFTSLPQWMLDAFMAHEAGHAVRRHVETSRLLSAAATEAFGLIGALLSEDRTAGHNTGAELGALAVQLAIPKFTQGQEYEADAFAVGVLRREGYPSPGDIMARALSTVGGVGGGWFDSHPSTPDRVRRLQGKR